MARLLGGMGCHVTTGGVEETSGYQHSGWLLISCTVFLRVHACRVSRGLERPSMELKCNNRAHSAAGQAVSSTELTLRYAAAGSLLQHCYRCIVVVVLLLIHPVGVLW